MGLDSYISVKRSMYLKQGKRTIDLDNIEKHTLDDYYSDEFGVSNRVEITEQVCYLRKANQIHRWFVDNVQDGEDNCQESYVEENKLKELYNICKKIVEKLNGVEFTISDSSREIIVFGKFKESFKFNSKNIKQYFKGNDCIWNYTFKISDDLKKYIDDNLPCGEGFFFGTYEYDGGYVYDIIKTILMFDRLFKKLDVYKKNKVWFDIIYQSSW